MEFDIKGLFDNIDHELLNKAVRKHTDSKYPMKKQEISVEKLLDIIKEKERRIAELEQQVQWFMEQIRLSKRKQFGVSSEQTKIEQLNLFNEDEETHNLAVSEPQRIEVKTHYRKRTRLTTDKLPEDLPVEVIEHKLPEKDSICPDCGGDIV